MVFIEPFGTGSPNKTGGKTLQGSVGKNLGLSGSDLIKSELIRNLNLQGLQPTPQTAPVPPPSGFGTKQRTQNFPGVFSDPEGLAPLQTFNADQAARNFVEGFSRTVAPIAQGIQSGTDQVRKAIQESLNLANQRSGQVSIPAPVGGGQGGGGQVTAQPVFNPFPDDHSDHDHGSEDRLITTPQEVPQSLEDRLRDFMGGGGTGSSIQFAPLPQFQQQQIDQGQINSEVARLIELEFGGREDELRRQMELLGIRSERDVDVLQNLIETSPEIIEAVFEGVQDRQLQNNQLFETALDQSRARLDSLPGNFADFFSDDAFGAEGRSSVLANIGESLGQATANLENQGTIGFNNLLQQMNDTAAETVSQVGGIQSQLAADIADIQKIAAEENFEIQSQLNRLLEERGLAGTQLAVELKREAEALSFERAQAAFNRAIAERELQMAQQRIGLDQEQQRFNQFLGLENLKLDQSQQDLLRDQFGLDRTIADRNFAIDQGELALRNRIADIDRQISLTNDATRRAELEQRKYEAELDLAAQLRREQADQPRTLESLRSSFPTGRVGDNQFNSFRKVLTVSGGDPTRYSELLSVMGIAFNSGLDAAVGDETAAEYLRRNGFSVPSSGRPQALNFADNVGNIGSIQQSFISKLIDTGFTYFG